MRRQIAVAAVLAFVVGVLPVWADQDVHDRSVEQVLSDIRGRLNLGPNDRIDPQSVPGDLLGELGDAVMGVMAGSEEQHEWMDQMMGGEGSQSLAAAHRWMGYRYLSGGYGGLMMGPGMMGYGGMMTGPSGGRYRWGMMGDPNVPYNSVPYDSPEQIAKRRYAQGEITREQYLQLLEDLKK